MAKWFLKNHDFIHVNSSVAGKYNKHKQEGSHLGFRIRMILATVDLQVTWILDTSNELCQLPFRFRRKSSKQILKMDAMAAIWDFLLHWFELFLSISHPNASYQVSSQLAFQFRRRSEKRFSRRPPSWISDWNDFSYFYIYMSSRCFLPIFQSTGPLVQENKLRKEFQRWWPSWISNPNNLKLF